jgi:2-aminoadipate transaminase
VDADGMVRQWRASSSSASGREGRRCKLIYTIVNFQNPAGPTLSLERRHELVRLAQEYDTVILEDDAYGELRFEGKQLPSLFALDPTRVMRARHRLEDPRRRLPPRLALRRSLHDAHLPELPVRRWRESVRVPRGHVLPARSHAKHVALLVDVYRAKRDAMLRACGTCSAAPTVEISKPEGGFFIWIKLPTGPTRRVCPNAPSTRGVQITPGTSFFINGGGENFIRLAYQLRAARTLLRRRRILAEAILDSRR